MFRRKAKLVVVVSALVIVALHVVWTTKPKTEFVILQSSVRNFDSAVLSQRRPLVIFDDAEEAATSVTSLTAERLARGHYWFRSVEVSLAPSPQTILESKHKFVWVCNDVPNARSAADSSAKIRLMRPGSLNNDNDDNNNNDAERVGRRGRRKPSQTISHLPHISQLRWCSAMSVLTDDDVAPHVEVILHPGCALVLPRGWLFIVAGDVNVTCFSMDDVMSFVVNTIADVMVQASQASRACDLLP